MKNNEANPNPPPAAPLRVLVLEDEARDAELMQAQLRALGLALTVEVVSTEAGFHKALQEFAPDIILADYSLPGFDGLSALKLARELRREAPFIFVSGQIGEEMVADLLRNGASDLVVKHNLRRLGPAVLRATHELRQRAEARRAVQGLREAIEVLRSTKRSFKSKALGDLRGRLEQLVQSTPWW